MVPPPKAVRLDKTTNRLELSWPDGHAKSHAAHLLRCECRCASCVDEVTGVRILDIASVPADIAIVGANLVGNYAIKLVFSDGHDLGLFTWDRLHDLDDPATT
ncbi:hypothetical protein Pan216_05900 [Planctomycetes bacterium Pan216]|uniref:Gamma-butyrobetaine hydroxylase-like N-terminal domain-containing protein n=1 Tax=Kolteria novifilia TaxID=2527975 RepID=A0A518AYF8_9BACT|nr:hypothetical protein Pan216_05900 [Planctomycetes bacterium Pan216]